MLGQECVELLDLSGAKHHQAPSSRRQSGGFGRAPFWHLALQAGHGLLAVLDIEGLLNLGPQCRPHDSLPRASFEPLLHWYPHRPSRNRGCHYCHVLVLLQCYRPLQTTSPEPPPVNHQHGEPGRSLAAVGVDITASEGSHGQSVWPTHSQCPSFSAMTKGQNISLIHQLKMEWRTSCSLGGNRVLEFEMDSFCPLYFTEHRYSDGNIQSDDLLMLWNQFSHSYC